MNAPIRREGVDYVLPSGRPVTECGCELGANDKIINDWILKFRRRSEVASAMVAEKANVSVMAG